MVELNRREVIDGGFDFNKGVDIDSDLDNISNPSLTIVNKGTVNK